MEIDVPQTTNLLLTALSMIMPVLMLSLPALTYMKYVNGQLEKIPDKGMVMTAPAPAPKRVAPCHYTDSGMVPAPPPIVPGIVQ